MTEILYENNIVYIQLDKDIATADGSTLGTDITYYFTTTYNPLYASVRQVRLDLGPFVSDVPDDTINLAIFEAGRDATINSFQNTVFDTTFFNHARFKYTLLLAELILLRAIMGDVSVSSRMTKSLGDLTVSRGGNIVAIDKRIEKLQEGMEEWLLAVQTGGEIPPGASLKSEVSVKGGTSEDLMLVGRQWHPTSGIGTAYSYPGGNVKIGPYGRKTLKTFRKR